MKNLLYKSVLLFAVLCLVACGETSNKDKEPDNFPMIKSKKSASVYKTFGRGINNKIVTFQQYYETKGKKAFKHLITISKPSNGRELAKPLPLDMETIRKFGQIQASKFEGDGPIIMEKEHQFKDKNQVSYWLYHEENTSKEVFLKEGTYSYIRKQEFEMLQIYDAVNDIEYMEMKMR